MLLGHRTRRVLERLVQDEPHSSAAQSAIDIASSARNSLASHARSAPHRYNRGKRPAKTRLHGQRDVRSQARTFHRSQQFYERSVHIQAVRRVRAASSFSQVSKCVQEERLD